MSSTSVPGDSQVTIDRIDWQQGWLTEAEDESVSVFKSRLVGFERAGVELPLEDLLSLLGDAIQAASDALQQAPPDEGSAAIAGVLARDAAQLMDGHRGQVPVALDEQQYEPVSRTHPLGHFWHASKFGDSTIVLSASPDSDVLDVLPTIGKKTSPLGGTFKPQ